MGCRDPRSRRNHCSARHSTQRVDSRLQMRVARVIRIFTIVGSLAVEGAAAQQLGASTTDSSESISLIHEAFRRVLQSGYSKASLQEQISLLQRALVLARRGNAPTVEVEALYWISDYFRRQGTADSALAYGYRMVRTARSNRDSVGEATGSFALAEV